MFPATLIQGEHAMLDCEHVSSNPSRVSDNVSAQLLSSLT